MLVSSRLLSRGIRSSPPSPELRRELRSLSLGAPARLILRLRGAVRLGAAKPRRFRAPVDLYLVKGERGYFISYKQGWHGVFYAPEEDGE